MSQSSNGWSKSKNTLSASQCIPTSKSWKLMFLQIYLENIFKSVKRFAELFLKPYRLHEPAKRWTLMKLMFCKTRHRLQRWTEDAGGIRKKLNSVIRKVILRLKPFGVRLRKKEFSFMRLQRRRCNHETSQNPRMELWLNDAPSKAIYIKGKPRKVVPSSARDNLIRPKDGFCVCEITKLNLFIL